MIDIGSSQTSRDFSSSDDHSATRQGTEQTVSDADNRASDSSGSGVNTSVLPEMDLMPLLGLEDFVARQDRSFLGFAFE